MEKHKASSGNNHETCLTEAKNLHPERQVGWKCRWGQAVDNEEMSHTFVQSVNIQESQSCLHLSFPSKRYQFDLD